MSGAYYNEIDPDACATLRELIQCGLIAPGDVDSRSIRDVAPVDLRGYTQHHFFAGFGVWSYALRQAGWPDDRPVWTGSCPCQPLSNAGTRKGFADERHLWPDWHWIIQECRPVVIFGEQVASKLADDWIDLVHADLEGLDYAFGCTPFPAASVGAPHIRDRNYWMAYAGRPGLEVIGEQFARHELAAAERNREVGVMGDTDGERLSARWPSGTTMGRGYTADSDGSAISGAPFASFWNLHDWIYCTDERWRAVEPGAFPLADGAPARMGRLRGYGNAIVAPQAVAFIEAAMAYLDASAA